MAKAWTVFFIGNQAWRVTVPASISVPFSLLFQFFIVYTTTAFASCPAFLPQANSFSEKNKQSNFLDDIAFLFRKKKTSAATALRFSLKSKDKLKKIAKDHNWTDHCMVLHIMMIALHQMVSQIPQVYFRSRHEGSLIFSPPAVSDKFKTHRYVFIMSSNRRTIQG